MAEIAATDRTIALILNGGEARDILELINQRNRITAMIDPALLEIRDALDVFVNGEDEDG